MKGGFKRLQDGYWEYFYPSGQLYYEGVLSTAKKTRIGNFTTMMEKFGKKVYRDQNGNWITYFESGQKAMEGKFKNDKEDGIWKSWYENGQLKDKAISEEE